MTAKKKSDLAQIDDGKTNLDYFKLIVRHSYTRGQFQQHFLRSFFVQNNFMFFLANGNLQIAHVIWQILT